MILLDQAPQQLKYQPIRINVMKIDVTKIDIVLIYDENNQIVDRFQLGRVSLIKDKINGTRLELKKYNHKHTLDEKTI